jgi:integrase
MANIRANNGKLFFDFRYLGVRCREYTALTDTKSNRKQLEKILSKIETEITTNTFDYHAYFPNSTFAKKQSVVDINQTGPMIVANAMVGIAQSVQPTIASPLFKDFAQKWFDENSVGWRRTYTITIRGTIDGHLMPYFGEMMVSSIRREDVLDFRAKLAKAPGRKGQSLSARRINAVILNLSQIMNEAADRFNFTTPIQRLKPLKVKRGDLAPFTLDEVKLLIDHIRADYRDYLIVRFFTGMRTSEIHGLKWQYIDFTNRQILIRETLVWGEMDDDGKTALSIREIQMSEVVYQALLRQREVTAKHSEFVFCNANGHPLNLNNVTNRVWYPLLRYLNLKQRRPYMTRHTAATLWLAAGENPEWIARQLGHSTTEMLFRVYSRFVPNLTRHDGSAFDRLLQGNLSYADHHQAISTSFLLENNHD